MGSSPIISTTNTPGQRPPPARRPGPSGFARLVRATTVPLGFSAGSSTAAWTSSATDHQQERGIDFWVMRDPWSNEFCVLQPNFPELLARRRPWPTLAVFLHDVVVTHRRERRSGRGEHRYSRWRTTATTANFPGGRARERGGGTRERSIDMGAPLRGHGRAIGRPGAPFTSTPERHDHAIHFRTAPRRRRPRTRIHPRRDPRHPVDARIRIRTGPADPDRPPRRTAQDVPPAGGPGPALRGGGLRRGHHRAPRER